MALAAGTAAVPARADDGASPEAQATGAALPVEIAAPVADAVAETEAVVEAVVAEPEEPTVETPEAAVAAPEAVDTTPEPQAPAIEGDIGGTTPDESAPSSPSEGDAVAVQESPANLNVSVRIDSAGDDAAVTQENLTGAIAPKRSQPATTQAMSTEPSGNEVDTQRYQSESEKGKPSNPATDTAPSTPETDPTWSWNWNCGSQVSEPPLLSDTTANWNWIWNWSCGDIGAGSTSTQESASSIGQYHRSPLVQYQPVNVNVSIRIRSPGNNGPVTQTNLAVAISLPPLTVPPAPDRPPHEGERAPPAAAPAVVIEAAMSAVSEIRFDLGPIELVEFEGSLTVDGEESLLERLWPVAPGLPFEAGELVRRTAPAASRSVLLPRTRAAPHKGWSAVVPAPSSGRASTAAKTVKRPSAGERQPKPVRWRPRPQPRLALERAPATASVAPGVGGGSSSGGLPLLLAVPFVIAVLDLARRAVLARTALPTEHLDRRPERPG